MKTSGIIIGLFFILFFPQFYFAQDDATVYHEYNSIAEALKNPQAVKKLNLKKAKLKEFPADIFKFENLEQLDISKNKIKELPAEILKLNKLKVLDLSQNKIEYIPASIGELVSLEILKMGQNEIYSLPKEMGKLTKLQYIDIWGNNISDLPDELKHLPKLKTIDMRMIQLNKQQQVSIQEKLPSVTIHFSQHCNCN